MVNFLGQLENPQFNFMFFYEVMRDFRKGGLNPTNYDDFVDTIKRLPALNIRKITDYNIFDSFNFTNITEDDFQAIMREITKRSIELSKTCWHPEAGPQTCKVDAKGRVIISAAHSIQNNGILNKIAESGHVTGYSLDKAEFDGKNIGKNIASIFWGFCNIHDAIFNPIEKAPYIKTVEQNFLFAYRGFVVSSHKKKEVSNWINYGEQAENDIVQNKKIFDAAIINKDYSIIETAIFELPAFYPIAVSSAFYLDFDFEGNPITHSEERIEEIFVSLFPDNNKTYFLLSYFVEDIALYGRLGGDSDKCDHTISAQADHPFRGKLTRAFRGKLTHQNE